MAEKRTLAGKIAKMEYNNEYSKKNYDTVNIRPPKGTRAIWKEYAESMGLSVNQLIIKAVEEYVKNHKEA